VIIDGMKAAKPPERSCPFDLNLPRKALEHLGGHERALTVIAEIAQYVDVLVGNEEDLQKGWAFRGRRSIKNRNSIRVYSSG